MNCSIRLIAFSFHRFASLALLGTVCLLPAHANPSGGNVAAGSATIAGTGTSSVSVHQTSPNAVINWNSFSINSGELTTFLQPNTHSAVLNRVTGGGTSVINGTLNANGQVFLINGNGILVGQGGVINAAGFTASTEDISNLGFMMGHYQFSGKSSAGVENNGTINALGGSIYLIGQTVENEGTLNAPNGTVGLAAGRSVLLKQSGDEHVFVSSDTKVYAGAAGVKNGGTIAAAAAELRAAHGNLYALAINNSGTIRATTVKNQGGHVWLTSDKGTILNTGTIDASAHALKGAGGQITLKSGGTVVSRGSIAARGGLGGSGGSVDLSGNQLDFSGVVDLTASGGTTGNLLLDPSSITIVSDPFANGTITTTGSTTTYTPAPNYPGSTLYNQVLEAQLIIANVIVDGVNNVTVAAPVTWDSPATLTLQTSANSGGTIVINAPITAHYNADNYAAELAGVPPNGATALPGTSATLQINAKGNGYATTGVNGTIDVDNFFLENGFWRQIVTTAPITSKTPVGYMNGNLPAFNVSNDFRLLNTTTFQRYAGGDGKPVSASHPGDSPYQIVDMFGVQGIGSPSGTQLSLSYILNNNINFDYATSAVTGSTVYWNGGAGFVPIGEGGKTIKPFTGNFDGNNNVIAGFYYYRPDDNMTGLFAESQTGTIKNLSIDVAGAEGVGVGGILVGRLISGTVLNCYVGANLDEPEPATPSAGFTGNQSKFVGNLGVSAAAAAIVGEAMSGSHVTDCATDVTYELLDNGGGISGLIGFAGIVGVNYGIVTNCYSYGGGGLTSVNVSLPPGSTGSGANAANSSISLGGLVGTNYGTINGGAAVYNTISPIANDDPNGTPKASILSGPGNFYVGGFVGVNYGTIDGTTTIKINGVNTTKTYQAFTNNNVVGPANGNVDGGTGSYYVGGFAGANYGTINNAYAGPSLVLPTTVSSIGPIDTTPYANSYGEVIGFGNLNGPSGSLTGALGNYAIGGFAGGNFGRIVNSGTEDSVTSHGNVAGIADVVKTTSTGTTRTPAVVNIRSPLALDSILVGGFVGLNGSGGSVTGSFVDTATKTFNDNIHTGQTITLGADPSTDDPLVFSDGNITGGNGYYIIGGFAGANYGTLSTSYNTGNVEAIGNTHQSNSFFVGGFTGIDNATISNVYNTGNVTSLTVYSGNQTGIVGGLVGEMFGGKVTNTYSTGTVTGGITRGGLIGVISSGSATGSFWETDSNPNLAYSAGGTGVKAEPLSALQITLASEPASIYGGARWDFKSIWTAGNSAALPTLRNVP